MENRAEHMLIGYQGDVGSNSEEAAHVMAARGGLDGAEYLPLVSSARVVEALRDGSADLGVLAVRNSVGGIVAETAEALAGNDFEMVDTEELAIKHYLFKRPDVPLDELSRVASHPQALKQTRLVRYLRFPQLEEVPISDTAIGARWLSDGTLPRDTAVLCSRRAGFENGLELVAAGLADDVHNRTRFVMLRKR